MTAEIAKSAAPDWALSVWCDLRNIYVQLPSQHGPCVITYPRDSRGLSLVLDLMKSRHDTEGYGQVYLVPPPPIKRDDRFSPNQRDLVRDVMRKAGIARGKR